MTQTVTLPTIELGAKGDAVKRAQRALRRTSDFSVPPSVVVDGIFGPATQQAIKDFQSANPPLAADGIVGPETWSALPDGGPMPLLKEGLKADAVHPLQQALADGAGGQWGTGPGQIDGVFGPKTRASVEALQKWGKVTVDGIVGDRTWTITVVRTEHNVDLEVVVGLQYIVG